METQNDEHKRIDSGESESVIIHLETTSRSSSSSSSSSYLLPSKNLPDTEIPPTDSPPVQVMERDDNDNNVDQGLNYDPNRIPSSVFERSKSNIPAEWSCTSNESLFSIHLGRNSFYGSDLMKSGELLAYSPALPMPPPPGAESKPVEQEEESAKVVVVDSDKEKEVVLVVKEERHREEKEEDQRESHEKEQQQQQHPAVSWKTPTTSYRSNRSSNSAHSFTFPILAGAASEPANAETEEQKKQAKQSQDTQQPAEAEANQKQSMCRWFSCFHPCPWCCASHSPCSCS